MIYLGIESSCDETAMAIVEDGVLRSSVVASQIATHRQFGGVVPEIAAREHVMALIPVLDLCLRESGLSARDIDAIGVTSGPGLIGALLVGVSAAKSLAYILDRPIYAVHHILAHIAANALVHEDFRLPTHALVVSGGHTHLYEITERGEVRTLARTRDDAAGETLDKVSRAMGLPYPGGPEIDRLAREGDPHRYQFPKIQLSDGSQDFSFSGLKTAALNLLNHLKQTNGEAIFEGQEEKADFAASFQRAVVDQLLDRTEQVLQASPCDRLALAGGVAANSELRERLQALAGTMGKEFYLPPLKYCGDNAAMVARMCQALHEMGVPPHDLSLNPVSSWQAEDYVHVPERLPIRLKR